MKKTKRVLVAVWVEGRFMGNHGWLHHRNAISIAQLPGVGNASQQLSGAFGQRGAAGLSWEICFEGGLTELAEEHCDFCDDGKHMETSWNIFSILFRGQDFPLSSSIQARDPSKSAILFVQHPARIRWVRCRRHPIPTAWSWCSPWAIASRGVHLGAILEHRMTTGWLQDGQEISGDVGPFV